MSRGDPPRRLLLVASAGGHLTHLWWLRDWWRRHARVWVTFDLPDARGRLAGEDVVWAHHPTNRDPVRLAANTALAWRTLRRVRPDVVVSAGAGVAVPFLLLAPLVGARTVHLEVIDRVDGLSVTGRIAVRVADAVVTQHPAQTAQAGGHAVELGTIR